MNEAAYWMVAVIGALQVKHFIFDFPLQTGQMARHKGQYGHPAGLQHAAGHGLGSIPAAIVAGTAVLPAVLVIIVEMVVHYHIDWMKSKVGEHSGLTPKEHWFWIAFGIDQGLHHTTYLAMAVLLIAYS